MVVNGYSVIMGICWFTLAFVIGSCLIIKGKKIRSELILLIFMLGVIRLFCPIEFWQAKEIFEWNIYPIMQDIWYTEIINEINIAQICLSIWGVGSVFCLCSFCRKVYLLKKIILQSQIVMPDNRLYKICNHVAIQLNYKSNIKVVVTKDFSTAISAGIFTPVILIPEAMENFSEEELIVIFRHELTHYLRKDLALQWLINLIQCIFWWNPIVYFVKYGIEQLIELQCDSMVCRKMVDEERIIYLQGIMHALKIPGKDPALGIGYAKKNSGKFLQRRFNEVLGNVKKQSKVVTILWALVCVVIFLWSYSFIVNPLYSVSEVEMEIQGLDEGNEEEKVDDFLLKIEDGTYWHFKDMIQEGILTEEEISKPPYNSLPIYDASEGE